jgi:hypothetical protein
MGTAAYSKANIAATHVEQRVASLILAVVTKTVAATATVAVSAVFYTRVAARC